MARHVCEHLCVLPLRRGVFRPRLIADYEVNHQSNDKRIVLRTAITAKMWRVGVSSRMACSNTFASSEK